MWRLEIDSGELCSSPARALMLGYDPASAPAAAEWWDSLLHPDERLAVRTARARHIQGDGSGYKSEYRARRQDGGWSWLLEIGCIERDATGRALRVTGVLLDISVEREQQFRIQQRLERLRTVFDYTYQFVALLSPDGILLETNRTALKAAGVTLDRVVGKPYWETPFWANHSAQQIAELRAGIERAGRGEFVRMQHNLQPQGETSQIVDFSLRPVLDDEGKVVAIVPEGRDITDVVRAHDALRALEDRLAVATSSGNLGLWDIDMRTGAMWANDRWFEMLGYAPGDIQLDLQSWRALVHPNELPEAISTFRDAVNTAHEFHVECRLRCKDGSWRWIHAAGRPVALDARGVAERLAGVHLDVTERKEAEMRLASSERLESVGKLAAGIAHEINTPVQFVSDSVYFANDAVGELLALTERMRAVAAGDARLAEHIAPLCESLPYLADNLPRALERALDGLKRVAEIVRSMKEFAHPDQPEMTEVDLNHSIENSLVVARSEYKYVADVQTDFVALPLVRCHGGEINQVILNLIVNAAHAIADVVKGSGSRGTIRVSTRQDGDHVVISIADSGSGIAEHIRHRIFEPFFTTKEVGRGTGQGLALAHNIVVKRHGGQIDFQSELGRGTVFHIRLPRDCRRPAAAARIAPAELAPERAA